MKIKMFILYIFILLILAFILFFIYCVNWTYKVNKWQNSIGVELPKKFKRTMQIQRDANGYFCINSQVDGIEKSFILDTKATSMSRIENLRAMKADYWGTYPIPVKNLYGQQERLPLYKLGKLAICNDLFCNSPLFKGISDSNVLYSILYKDVLGKDILRHFVWKFSIDDNNLTLLSNVDTLTLKDETKNYTKIEEGLNSGVPLQFTSINYQCNFDFDLGFQGCISINKKIFELLRENNVFCEKYINQRVIGRVDTAYVFEHVNLKIMDLNISNCTLCYYPLIDRNLLGVRFIERFNFILGYQKKNDTSWQEDLYIQPRNLISGDDEFIFCPKIGFDVNVLGKEVFVTLLRIDKGGNKLKVGDKVVEINNGEVSINTDSVASGNVTSYLQYQEKIRMKIERNGEILSIDI